MKIHRLFLILCSLGILLSTHLSPNSLRASDQIPAPPQERPIAVRGGTVHTMADSVFENGTILFENGRITAVGSEVSLPKNAVVIDATGQYIYPAFIAASTTLGLTEVSAVRATRDYNESGLFTPEVRAKVAINPDSELLPVTRSNGVAIALSIPSGGLISGTSTAIMLDGWTWEDMTLSDPVGMHIRWPRMQIPAFDSKAANREKKETNQRLDTLQQFIDDVKAYAEFVAENPALPSFQSSTRFEAMIPVIEKQLPVFVHAERIKEIRAAVNWCEKNDLTMILVGGSDAWRVPELLRSHGIAVILEEVQQLPRRSWEAYDTPFTSAVKLHQAGVQFCIAGSESSFEAAHQRNLPYHAATAAAYGLPEEVALKSITRYPAEILGIENRLGTLEIGKDATFIITNGDPLEVTTQVIREFIQGRDIDLSSRHTELHKKYRTKYERRGLIDAEDR